MALHEKGLRTRLTALKAERLEQAAEEVAEHCESHMGPTTAEEELTRLKAFLTAFSTKPDGVK